MAKKKNKSISIGDVLRQAIRDSGQSANEIAKATGVPQPTITRFLAGADMKLQTAGILAEHLCLKLSTQSQD